jgi:MFS family permease
MHLFHNYHFNDLYKKLHSAFGKFDFSIWLHVFARSLIAIFVPILLLQMDFTLTVVLMYYAFLHLINIPMNFFAGWLTRKIGARKVIMFGILCLIAHFIVLYSLVPGQWSLLVLLAFFAAMYDALYWVAHIFFFMKCSDNDDNVSKDASFLYIVKTIAGILAPFFGALILVFVNQQVLIGISIIILITSLWPLFAIKKIPDKPTQPRVKYSAFFKDWKTFKDYFLLSLFGVHGSTEAVIWPIFIFVLFQDIKSVAALPIIISVTTMIFAFVAGRIKKQNRATIMAIGGGLIAITWILRLAITLPMFYYFSVFLIGFFAILILLPMDSNIYEHGEKMDALAASTVRNAISMASRLIYFIILLIVVEVFKIGFILAAISMFAFMVISFLSRSKLKTS